MNVQPQSGRRSRRWLSWLAVGLLALLINWLLITTVGIRGNSMSPTLENGDRALVPRYEHWLKRMLGSGYARGDIVFFPDPTRTDCRLFCPHLIKRIVGLPGETVEIRRGTVYIDGEALAEPYLADAWQGSYSQQPLTLPGDSYYVLGDNRFPYGSQDSRSFGPVPASSVAGRASLLIWPPLRLQDGSFTLNVGRL